MRNADLKVAQAEGAGNQMLICRLRNFFAQTHANQIGHIIRARQPKSLHHVPLAQGKSNKNTRRGWL